MGLTNRDVELAQRALKAGECRRHPGNVLATCGSCYDAALRQQQRQRSEEQKRAHVEYLARRAAGGAR